MCMNVVIAIDSFKGSVSSIEAGMAAREGVLSVIPDANVVVEPLADGGEGTTYALTQSLGGRIEKITVTGPIGKPVEAEYGLIDADKIAIIEIANAAGITLIYEAERNPLFTTTYGVGEMINDAISKGCRKFIIGLGGSATNDGGIGMLQALGYGILDEEGKQVPHGAIGLGKIASISSDKINPLLGECTFDVACDVTNPLCGEDGCSAIFGPQKGATTQMVSQMDKWLADFAHIANKDAYIPGYGAAGGLGFAFGEFLNAKLEAGAEIVMRYCNLEDEIKDADVVITGEGKIDAQTAMGKAPYRVAELAKKYSKNVVAVAGSVDYDVVGFDACFSIIQQPCTLEAAMKKETTTKNIVETVKSIMQILTM